MGERVKNELKKQKEKRLKKPTKKATSGGDNDERAPETSFNEPAQPAEQVEKPAAIEKKAAKAEKKVK